MAGPQLASVARMSSIARAFVSSSTIPGKARNPRATNVATSWVVSIGSLWPTVVDQPDPERAT
jgi:hypothetical protein